MQVNPKKSLNIENIVASAKVTDNIDLVDIAAKVKGADYNKKRFPGVVIRTQTPKIAVLVFGSGKVVLTGGRCPEDLTQGLALIGNQLRSVGLDTPTNLTYTIHNIVTSADLGVTVNLNRIAVGLTLDRIEYEPEQFPGLVYRLDDPKVVVLLFGSGKIIITGGKVFEDAEMALTKIISDLRKIGAMPSA